MGATSSLMTSKNDSTSEMPLIAEPVLKKILEQASRSNGGGPWIIGICGGSASGKTTFADGLLKSLGPSVLLVKMDSFYRPLSTKERELANQSMYNFDIPEAFDLDRLSLALENLRLGKEADIPKYSFLTHQRDGDDEKVGPAAVVVVEGILAFHDSRVCALMDTKVFIDTDEDIRLQRRLERDVVSRGWTREEVLEQYAKFVKPAYDLSIAPCKPKADFTIEGSTPTAIAVHQFGEKVMAHFSIPTEPQADPYSCTIS